MEIHDSLMRDTVHIFIAKSKQLTNQKVCISVTVQLRFLL